MFAASSPPWLWPTTVSFAPSMAAPPRNGEPLAAASWRSKSSDAASHGTARFAGSPETKILPRRAGGTGTPSISVAGRGVRSWPGAAFW